MQRPVTIESSPPSMRHVRAPQPLVFRSKAQVPESKRHLELRTLLYLVLKRAFSSTATIGSEQFVYFSASDPRKCVAPDVFVRRGLADHDFASWKTWERGAPELAVEIISESENVASWDEKVESYHELGILELVRFDAGAPAGSQLRVWDRLEGDLVERVVEGDRTPCNVLRGDWLVRPTAGYPTGLRLADATGVVLPTAEERVAELEALLTKR
jgi:Uma2 family endonuclease